MPSKSKLAGVLADRLDRLRGAFAALHRSLTDRVAEIVGAAVAGAVRDTVRIALDPPAPVVPAPVVRRDPYDPWGGPESDRWADEHDPIDDRDTDTWGYPPPVRPAAPPERPVPPPEPPCLSRLAAAVGLRAAAWWLATRTARRGWGCILAGLTAGTAAYALGPVALAVAPAVAALALAFRSAESVNLLPV